MPEVSEPNLIAALKSVLTAVKTDLAPDLKSPYAQHRAQVMTMLLTRLIVDLERAGPDAERWKDLRALMSGPADTAAWAKELSDKLATATPSADTDKLIASVAKIEAKERGGRETDIVARMKPEQVQAAAGEAAI